MIKKVLLDVTHCDFCGSSDDVYDSCRICKKDVCINCIQEHFQEYPAGIYHSSSFSDGCYCNECDSKLKELKIGYSLKQARKIVSNQLDIDLHNAYLLILKLKNEETKWRKDFKERCNITEEEIERLVEQANKDRATQ